MIDTKIVFKSKLYKVTSPRLPLNTLYYSKNMDAVILVIKQDKLCLLDEQKKALDSAEDLNLYSKPDGINRDLYYIAFLCGYIEESYQFIFGNKVFVCDSVSNLLRTILNDYHRNVVRWDIASAGSASLFDCYGYIEQICLRFIVNGCSLTIEDLNKAGVRHYDEGRHLFGNVSALVTGFFPVGTIGVSGITFTQVQVLVELASIFLWSLDLSSIDIDIVISVISDVCEHYFSFNSLFNFVDSSILSVGFSYESGKCYLDFANSGKYKSDLVKPLASYINSLNNGIGLMFGLFDTEVLQKLRLSICLDDIFKESFGENFFLYLYLVDILHGNFLNNRDYFERRLVKLGSYLSGIYCNFSSSNDTNKYSIVGISIDDINLIARNVLDESISNSIISAQIFDPDNVSKALDPILCLLSDMYHYGSSRLKVTLQLYNLKEKTPWVKDYLSSLETFMCIYMFMYRRKAVKVRGNVISIKLSCYKSINNHKLRFRFTEYIVTECYKIISFNLFYLALQLSKIGLDRGKSYCLESWSFDVDKQIFSLKVGIE